MIVLIDGIRYQLTKPKSEAVLENAIQSNCQHIFGPDSFYFDIKKLIRSKAGVASIPDGYVIFFTPKPRWAIIEVELASHPIHNHVIPQLNKFNIGIEDSSTRKKLVEILYGVFDEDEVLKARLKQKIKTGEIYKFISDLVSEKPLIVVAIDQRTEELNEALKFISGEVKVVEFRTFRREDVSDDVNAYMFEPVFSEPAHTGNGDGRGTDKFGSRLGSNKAKINAVLSTEPKMMKTLVQEAGLSGGYYNHLKSLIEKGFVEKTDKGFREIVGRKPEISGTKDHPTRGIMHSVFELFDKKGVDNVTYHECESIAKEVKPDTKFGKSHFSWYKNKYKRKRKGGLPRGLKLRSVYKGIEFTAELVEDEKIRFRDHTYNSPSAAAIAAIQSTGSKRKNEDGLRWWKFVDPETGEEKPLGTKSIIGPEPEPRPDGYSEFWAPIRKKGLFKGKPVPIKHDRWISKSIKGINISLNLHNHKCSIQLSLKGPDRKNYRDKVAKLFPKTKYEYEIHEAQKSDTINFPVLDKGKKDRKDWSEIRKELTKLGADIYTKIIESDI